MKKIICKHCNGKVMFDLNELVCINCGRMVDIMLIITKELKMSK